MSKLNNDFGPGIERYYAIIVNRYVNKSTRSNLSLQTDLYGYGFIRAPFRAVSSEDVLVSSSPAAVMS